MPPKEVHPNIAHCYKLLQRLDELDEERYDVSERQYLSVFKSVLL